MLDRILARFKKHKLTHPSKVGLYDVKSEPANIGPLLDVDTILNIFQESEQGDTERLFALYRDFVASDSHAQGEMLKRLSAPLLNPISISAEEDGNPTHDAAADFLKLQVDACPNFNTALTWLMQGALWPCAVVEKVFKYVGGPYPYRLAGLVPVPYHLLDYKTGHLRIFELDTMGRKSSVSHPADPDRYIVHRGHLLSSHDSWGGPLRSIIFWWFLSTQSRSWWARMLDRHGSPFLVGRFEPGDQTSQSILERAFALATKLGGLVVSNETKVEMMRAAESSASDAFEKFHALCNREKSKLIIGQTMSAEAQSTGIGSGNADAHEAVRSDLRKFDSAMLSATLRDQLFAQLLRLNYVQVPVPKVGFGSDEADAETFARMLAALSQAGYRVADASLAEISRRFGLEIERAPAAPQFPGVAPFTAAAPQPRPPASPKSIMEDRAADLWRTLSVPRAEALRILRRSESYEQAVRDIKLLFARHDLTPLEADLEAALAASAAAGLLSCRTPK
jgi:phage gp29-like protein